jgi:ring-1,2-phenylacetyl-CoA epoxidase subunit PaaD
MVSAGQVWRWLGAIPDPEIPVLSLVDLGVIRDVRFDGDTLVVAVTPTYSGCPATTVINLDIETALRAHGVDKLRLERRLSPPWTTDWISEDGRRKLREYGIAPPIRGAPVACPRCGSARVRKVSQFGSTPCKANYVCEDCLEPFDLFKCI